MKLTLKEKLLFSKQIWLPAIVVVLAVAYVWYTSTHDVNLGVELQPGESITIYDGKDAIHEVSVEYAWFLSEAEIAELGVEADGQTLIAVALRSRIINRTYHFSTKHMRLRNSDGELGEVLSYTNGIAICRIPEPWEQISFYIYADQWHESDDREGTARCKIEVSYQRPDEALLENLVDNPLDALRAK